MSTTTVETLADNINNVKNKLNRASLLLSGLSDFRKEQEKLGEEINLINHDVGEKIKEVGIEFWVLYSDRTSATHHLETGIQIDTEEWYIYNKNLNNIYDSLDTKTKGLIQECLYKFEEEVYKETERLIRELGISYESLDILAEW